MKTAREFADDLLDAAPDFSAFYELTSARDAEHRAELTAAQRTIAQLGKDGAEIAGKLDRAVELLRRHVGSTKPPTKDSPCPATVSCACCDTHLFLASLAAPPPAESTPVQPAPQPAPPRLSTPVPLPWDMPTLSREDARIARERINPAPRWPSQPEPDKVIASCEAGIDECSFECQQYGQRHTPENAGTARPTDQTVDVPQPAPSGDEAKVRGIRDSWMPPGNRLAVDWPGRLNEAVREAYAAGKADGAREVAKRLTLLCDQTDGSADYHCGLRIAENEAYAIARRGSEGT